MTRFERTSAKRLDHRSRRWRHDWLTLLTGKYAQNMDTSGGIRRFFRCGPWPSRFIRSLADSNGLSDVIDWDAVAGVVRADVGIAPRRNSTLTSRSPSGEDGFSGSRLIAGSARPLFISRTRATVFRVVPIVELQRLGDTTRLQRSLKFQPIALALDEANLKTARGVERGVELRAQVVHHQREGGYHEQTEHIRT